MYEYILFHALFITLVNELIRGWHDGSVSVVASDCPKAASRFAKFYKQKARKG